MDGQRYDAQPFAVLLVTAGRLGDLFGRRRAFLFGVAVFGASSFMIGLAQSDTWLVFFRAVQGVGVGLHDARDAVDHHQHVRRRRSAAGRSARGRECRRWRSAIGPVVGGLLVQDVSWQSIFFLNVPVAVARDRRDAVRRARVAG